MLCILESPNGLMAWKSKGLERIDYQFVGEVKKCSGSPPPMDTLAWASSSSSHSHQQLHFRSAVHGIPFYLHCNKIISPNSRNFRRRFSGGEKIQCSELSGPRLRSQSKGAGSPEPYIERNTEEQAACEDLCTSVVGLCDTVVGVLGGGQLGRMLCQAASTMGVKVAVLDPLENCPASTLAYRHTVGSFRDTKAVQEFAKGCGVLTIEIEHVDVETLEVLERQGVDCQPNASTIRLIQDKYLQKVHFRQYNVPLLDFMQIDSIGSAEKAGDLFSYPLMIKSRRLAYDGRGNAVAQCKEDIPASVSELGGFERGLYAEKWVPFIKELAVIVARGRDGSVCCFAVVETIHKDNICHMVEARANVSVDIERDAFYVAERAVSSHD